ncbi:MarR family winged helix-turn-helix transcriptional regulator [Actinoplanes sp. NPDC049265]|uniref:MarR family winged helix-turn-helix transcriptional regulator n=1 Tax=Actinoplanes sp. NPDC049265 TaxID=3363902 RepID=UPI0037125E49
MATWLTPEEQRVWRSLHGVLLVLPQALDRQLQQDSQLSLLEYYVVAGLSEAPGRTARLSDLALLTNAELSRISHLVARLERRGLVRRRPDPDDGRYTNAVLTEEGWEVVREAAPGHVAAVRRLVFAGLDEAGLRDLARQIDRLADSVGRPGWKA